MVRIDMSEYSEKHSVARLVGAPPGYVGYDEGGQLTEAVRRRPYSVILLDEVEKAHPDVFDILLQVLDDGRLTDGQGRTVDFRNTLLILTSNLGSQALMNQDLTEDQRKDAVMSVVRVAFKPEFLNRLDDIVFFHGLDIEQLGQIVDIQIQVLSKRLAARRLILEVTREARDWLAIGGFDPQYGARPLRRLVQSAIGDQLAKELLAGRIRDGQTVLVDVNDDDPGALIVRSSDAVPTRRRSPSDGAAEELAALHTDRRPPAHCSDRLADEACVERLAGPTSRWSRRSPRRRRRPAPGSPWPGRSRRPGNRR